MKFQKNHYNKYFTKISGQQNITKLRLNKTSSIAIVWVKVWPALHFHSVSNGTKTHQAGS